MINNKIKIENKNLKSKNKEKIKIMNKRLNELESKKRLNL